MKKIKDYIINIILVLGIFFISLYLANIYPFGNLLLGKSDSFAQYKPMLFNFIMNIKNGTLAIYSFNNGLGNSFLFNYLYYLVSPINLVALPFNDSNIMFLIVICTKLIFTTIFVTFYAKKKNSTNLIATIAAISYAFSGWFIAYYYNIMWLDLFMMFPLFQHGLERLIDKKKCLVFIFTLAYIYATNFLIAFSILIYMIIYFIVRNFFYNKDSIKEKLIKLGLFLGSTLLSVLLIAFYIAALSMVKKQMGLGFSDVNDSGYTLEAMGFIQSLIYGNYNLTTIFDGTTFPNLGMNTIVLLSLFYCFFNKDVSVKNKVYTLIGLNLVVYCLFIKQFDYVVNMFHNVVGLTYRYAFIFSFLAIMLFIDNAKKIDMKNNKKIYIPIGIALLLMFICRNVVSKEILIMNIVYIFSYLVIIIFYNDSKYYKLLILFLVCSQSIYVLNYSLPYDRTLEQEDISNTFYTEDFKYRVNYIDDNDFTNKNLYTNQDTTTLFTSMSYNEVLVTLKDLGCMTGGNSIICYNNNELFNMLFNVKNDYYLEKIYSVNKDIYNVFLDEYNVKNTYEDIIDGMTGINDIFEMRSIKPIKRNDKYVYVTNEKSYFFDRINSDGSVMNKYQVYKEFYDTDNKDVPINIYVIKKDKLEEIYNKLSKNQIEYTYYSDTKIEGNINVLEDQIIFTSIPYDDAWKVKIDGKDVDTIKLLDSLLGIKCDSGLHTISLEYKVDLSKPLIVSIITLTLLVLKGLYNIRRDKKNTLS